MTKQPSDDSDSATGRRPIEMALAMEMAGLSVIGFEAVRDSEGLKSLDRLKRDFAAIGQRWDDFHSREMLAVWERYLSGDLEIIVFGESRAGIDTDNTKWAARIVAHNTSHPDECCATDYGGKSACGGDSRQNEVVFVDLIQLVECPERKVSVSIRFYRMLEECGDIRTGQGRLYLSYSTGLARYKILPFFMEREGNECSALVGGTHNGRGSKVERGSKVVYRVPDHESKILADRLFGQEGQFHNLAIRIGADGSVTRTTRQADGLDPGYLKQVRSEGLDLPYDLIDVVIGPLDL